MLYIRYPVDFENLSNHSRSLQNITFHAFHDLMMSRIHELECNILSSLLCGFTHPLSHLLLICSIQ